MTTGVPWEVDSAGSLRARSDTSGLGGDDLAEVRGRLRDFSRQLDELRRQSASHPWAGPIEEAAPREAAHGDLTDVIARLDHRVEQLIASRRSASEQIERHIGEAGLTASASTVSESANPLEQALAEIADRQRALDVDGGSAATRPTRPDVLPRAPTQNLSTLEEQLREISSRFDSLQPCGIDAAVETLRNDLAEIGLMVKEAMPRQAIEALEGEVRSLSERLLDSRRSGATDPAIESLQQGLAEIRDALRALTPAEGLVDIDRAVKELTQKIELAATGGRDTVALEQFESAVGLLRGVASNAASDGTLGKLSDEVRNLAAKIDQIASSADSGMGLLSTLEHRIAAIADALESHHPAREQAPVDLDAVVQGLTDRLERTGLARGEPIAVNQLEDRIARLVEKLDHSNARLDHLESIERGLSDLLASLERQRQSGGESEVGDLRQDIRQTQDSLQSVQGALSHLIDRLAVIEADIRMASAQAAPAPLLAPAAAEPFPLATPQAKSSTIIHERVTVAEPAAAPAPPKVAAEKPSPAAARERRPIDPNLPPDHPLEPGAVRARSSASPAERIAASEAALGSAKPTDVPEPDSKSNFIAAARRAARAASSETAARDSKRTRTTEDGATGGKPAGRLSDRLRKALVAVSVVAIVLGSLHLVASLFNTSDDAGTRTQPQEQPQSDAPAASKSSDAGADRSDSLTAPAPAPAATPGSPPGRQSVLIPMGDGTSMMFSTGGVGAQAVHTPALSPAEITAAQVAVAPAKPNKPDFAPPRQAAAAAAPDNDVTGSLAQPPAADAAAPEPGPAPLPYAPHPPALDKLPAPISGALRAAAAKGDASAEYEIGQRYAEGRGVTQDLAQAAGWFERAAQKGLVPAQFRLGALYEKGFGVKKDAETARRLYSTAAEAGNAKAMHNLAVLYAEGVNGKPDYTAAAKWFRKAAEYGMADSQYNLGILYARGIGVDINYAEAYKWFALAAREGDRESLAKREDVAGHLDQMGLAAAKLAVESFVPQQQPETATQVPAPAGGWDNAPAAAAPPAPARKPRAPASKLSAAALSSL